jgi:hypothetical protein
MIRSVDRAFSPVKCPVLSTLSRFMIECSWLLRSGLLSDWVPRCRRLTPLNEATYGLSHDFDRLF